MRKLINFLGEEVICKRIRGSKHALCLLPNLFNGRLTSTANLNIFFVESIHLHVYWTKFVNIYHMIITILDNFRRN